MIFVDFWVCEKCQSEHYGMCRKCGKCGRKFNEIGFLLNESEYPCIEEEE